MGAGGCCLSEASSWGLRWAGGAAAGVGTDTQHVRVLELVLPKGRLSVGNFISSLARWRSEMHEPEKPSYSMRQEVRIHSGPGLITERPGVCAMAWVSSDHGAVSSARLQ